MATTVDNRRETVSLIGSDKVEGTAVYGMDDRKIGNIQRVMIDKISGKVAYAVVSFGGFLGMGEDYYPMPWSSLKYDTNFDGYPANVTDDQLKGAPKFNRNSDWDWSDRSRDRTIHDYYGAKHPLRSLKLVFAAPALPSEKRALAEFGVGVAPG
jgi:PRC-barrel domain protein